MDSPKLLISSLVSLSLSFSHTHACAHPTKNPTFSFQMHLEDGVERIARSLGKPAILLCDRGTLDGAAYISKETWERLLRTKGLDPLRLREGRYDAVFHLVTAALGAESYYSLMNNATRTESPDFAREVNSRGVNFCRIVLCWRAAWS